MIYLKLNLAITEDDCHSVKISLSQLFPEVPPELDDHDISALGLMFYLLKPTILLKYFQDFYANSRQPLKKVAFSWHRNYKDMKFDIIIMNPPFGKLYIKILSEAMKHIAEDGKVMSLQPINKWQEAKLFGLENPVAGSVVVDRFSAKTMNDVFGISSSVDNGIVSNAGNCIAMFDNETLLVKLMRHVNSLRSLKSELEPTNIDRLHPVIFGIGAGINCAVKTRYRLCSAFRDTAMRPGEVGHAKKYYAKDAREQHLVWKFYQNPIIRFIAKEFGFGNVPIKIIPLASEFKDENGNTPLDAEWPFFKLAKWFDLTKQDLEYIYRFLEENMYDYEKAEIEEAIAEYGKSE